ncbi:MAG: PrpR N-terminal domain-containing protein [Treponema sp.]|jgi:transcriptional regulator with PAS, ATPase and Fis domain|nr:PrpR N-terminal domain-containing protein [Treponema sp.]
MKPLRVLAIAPYEGMKKLINQISPELEDFDLEVYYGDLSAGVQQVRKEQEKGFDFIISRGGTARLIEEEATIPVVEISISEYDILHAIRLAQGFSEKFCVTGFPNIIAQIQTICRLMEFTLDFSVITDEDAVEDEILRLKKEGYTLIVGDAITIRTAKKLHLKGVLIISGKERILAALNEGKKLCAIIEGVKKRNLLFKNVVDHCPLYVNIYDRQKKLCYSNTEATLGEEENTGLSRILPSFIEKVFDKQEIEALRKSGSFLWKIRGIRDGEKAYFYIRRTMETGASNDFLSVRDDFTGNKSIMLPFYHNLASVRSVIAKADKISRVHYPVIITGEPGTGKNSLAYYIHRQSALQDKTFLTINCHFLREKELHRLLEDEDSPLGENNISIHIKDIHFLSPEAQGLFVTYFKNTELHKRNRIFCSYTFSPDGNIRYPLVRYLKDEMEGDCFTVLIPPLREKKEYIPDLANFFINEFNFDYGRQIVGLDNRSLEILREYNWPENTGQFVRVMKELVLNADDAYIKPEDTEAVISKEKILTGENNGFFPLRGSLEKITDNIIWQVYKEEGMNQCRTSERLGISRSTLWRKIKNYHL